MLLILIAGLFLGYLFMKKKTEGLTPTFPSGYIKYPADFGIYNYLKKAIKVTITNTNLATDVKEGKSHTLVENLAPNTRVGVDKEDVIKYLVPESVIDIYIDGDHYSSILVDTGLLERIKNLHVGMVTTRFIGKTTDTLRLTTTSGNSIQGNAWLKIHNITDRPLRLQLGLETLTSEPDVEVPPHGTVKYLGYRHQGVTLGTYFKDPDGLYPVFQYLIPNSDLYYGLTSDLKQEMQGCFQLEFNDDCDRNQSLWPFELGIL
jgi:hypothetical protein